MYIPRNEKRKKRRYVATVVVLADRGQGLQMVVMRYEVGYAAVCAGGRSQTAVTVDRAFTLGYGKFPVAIAATAV